MTHNIVTSACDEEFRANSQEGRRWRAGAIEAIALLKRIRQWDMMDASDAAYWRKEIDSVLSKVGE